MSTIFGQIVRIGDDEERNTRIVVYVNRDQLKELSSNLLYRYVMVTDQQPQPEAAIALKTADVRDIPSTTEAVEKLTT